jgi:hypothetical protein
MKWAFPHCALNIHCTVTGDIIFSSHRTRWTFYCTEAIFKENQQQRSWFQKQYTEDTSMEIL